MTTLKSFSAAGLIAMALSAAPAAPAAAQEQIDLTLSFEAGDQTLVTVESVADIQIEFTDIDGLKTEKSLRRIGKASFVEKLTEVRDGAPASFDLNCLFSRVSQSGTAAKASETETSIHGKTLHVVFQGGEVRLAADGLDAVPPEDSGGVGTWYELRGFLPGKPVAIGDTWDVTTGGLIRLVVGGPLPAQPSLKCTLREVTADADGNRLAIVSIASFQRVGAVEKKPDGKDGEAPALQAEASLTGELSINLDTRKPAWVKLGGDKIDVTENLRDEKGRDIGSYRAKISDLSLSITFEKVK